MNPVKKYILAAGMLIYFTFSAGASGMEFVYEYTVASKDKARQVFGAVWKKTPVKGGFVINGVMKGMTQSVKCLDDGSAYEWEIEMQPEGAAESAKFNAVKDSAGRLSVNGTAAGKPFNSSLDLKGRIWIQDVALQAAPFVLSDRQEMDFIMVGGENDIKAVEMKLVKKEKTKMEINGAETEVVKAEMRLSGLLSFLWSAEYVFSAKTGEMLLFKSPDRENPDVTGRLVAGGNLK